MLSPSCKYLGKSKLYSCYFGERFSKNSVSELFVHNYKSPRVDEKVTHFSESYFVTCKDEDIKDDLLSNNSFEK
jgi:hypothetical protein